MGESGASWGKVGHTGVDRGAGAARPVFLGEYRHTVDDKGRVIIPSKFREGFGSQLIATRGLDRCLFLYPHDEWRQLEQKLRALPLAQREARAFVRFFFSGATECEFDRQGRISLPPTLREYAGLEKDAVIIGVSSRVEVWSAAEWDAYMAEAGESFGAIVEKVVDLGI